ncbi:MAG: TIGR03564 family F420-dependent LLM class oxidoreductase [Actinomycetota bacterium]
MDIGIFGFQSKVEDLIEEVATAAGQGFASFWVPQIFGFDALTALAIVGREVPEIKLGTSVIPTYPRHPMMLAQQALTVSQIIGAGRLQLGIGLSHQPVVEGMWGIPFEKPVRHMREYLSLLGPLLHKQIVSEAYETLTSRGQIDIPDAEPPSMLVAALGKQMLNVTGRLGDGTITWMTGEKTIAGLTAPTINAAAEAAGRPAPQVCVGMPICVTAEVDAARERAAREYEIYGQLPSYRAMLDNEGLDGPADLALIGSPDQISERIGAFEAGGATTFAASAFGNADEQAATREYLQTLL